MLDHIRDKTEDEMYCNEWLDELNEEIEDEAAIPKDPFVAAMIVETDRLLTAAGVEMQEAWASLPDTAAARNAITMEERGAWEKWKSPNSTEAKRQEEEIARMKREVEDIKALFQRKSQAANTAG